MSTENNAKFTFPEGFDKDVLNQQALAIPFSGLAQNFQTASVSLIANLQKCFGG